MKILFTKSEYRTLFDMIYIAEWLVTAFERPTDPALEAYAHLAQKIYSHAKEMGWEQLVDASARDNEYLPSETYEKKSGVQDLIDAYDDEIFWDAEEGVYRRETARAGGVEGGMSTGDLLVARAAMKPLACNPTAPR